MTPDPRPTLGRILAGHDGVTIIETVVAGAVLVIGLLGALTMLTGSLRGTAGNNARIAATNLSRELIEATRGLDFDDMTGSLVQTRLQARGIGAGSPWTIERRGVKYTITATSCTFDDPADGVAATPPDGRCTPAPTGTTGDPNGEDFRRTTFQLTWLDPGGPQRSVTQTTLVVNPSGGLGPRVSSFTPVTQTITSAATTASVVWTTTTAETLRWVVDDGVSSGSALGSTSFTTTWNIGTSGSGSEILDGAYQITGQPFDDRDVAGEAKRANVVLNRRRAYAPPSLAGGHNTRLGDWVELQWTPNGERDILGYRAVWAGADATAGTADDVQVCPAAGIATPLAPTTTSCLDFSPPTGATAYYLDAVDRDSSGALRDGDRRTLSIGAASARPHVPTGPLIVQTVNDQPRLSWNAPSQGSVSFYRIYRNGTRYDRTSTSATTFTDASAGSIAHVYWVTAVNSTFNESDAVGLLWLS